MIIMRTLFLYFVSFSFIVSALAVNSGEKAFEVYVSGAGPAMFLIPGASCSAAVWDETVARYKDHYQVYAFTLAGYGGAAPLKGNSILPVIKEQLKKYIMDHAGKNSIVIGHSTGGFLAMWMAAEEKDWSSKIIIADALPFLAVAQNPAMTVEMAKTQFANFKNYYLNMDDATLEQNQRTFLQGMIRNQNKIDFVLQQSVRSDRRTMGVTMYELMCTDLRQTIASITVPALVLTGWDENYDPLIGLTKKKKMALYRDQYKLWKGASVKVIDNARHFIMLDNPVAFYKQIDTFLNDESVQGVDR